MSNTHIHTHIQSHVYINYAQGLQDPVECLFYYPLSTDVLVYLFTIPPALTKLVIKHIVIQSTGVCRGQKKNHLHLSGNQFPSDPVDTNYYLFFVAHTLYRWPVRTRNALQSIDDDITIVNRLDLLVQCNIKIYYITFTLCDFGLTWYRLPKSRKPVVPMVFHTLSSFQFATLLKS